ncbi:hypothetical protein B7R22_00800 [Subtercola boreus]|uniref:Uncharacterized protein n=1 Tax=Subtercola boreus TaxID=120213 RepID=A0A3E0W6E1_9MICO|nr:hypothetical protein [Subtercola boreus]RFA17113.1 hypothetical protein B7R22_00800 [Subtercola boreus]
MSFEEKRASAFLLVAVAGYTAYVILVLPAFASTPLSQVEYVSAMLATIGGAVVVGILANVTIAVATPREARRIDQRDRDIDRLGRRAGEGFVIAGSVGALSLALLQVDYFWIANILYLGFVLSAVFGSAARLIAYRWGTPAW